MAKRKIVAKDSLCQEVWVGAEVASDGWCPRIHGKITRILSSKEVIVLNFKGGEKFVVDPSEITLL